MFDQIEARPADPILGLSAAYKKDTNPNKIDLGVGVYKDESGTGPVMKAVKTAERRKCDVEDSKAYIAQAGPEGFIRHTLNLILGNAHPAIRDGRYSTVLAPGGSGSLRLAAEFINGSAPGSKIFVSNPSWPNHVPLLSSSGLTLEEYPYYDHATHSLDFDAMMEALKGAGKGDLVLLHGCCHNPCGADLNNDQWQAVTDLALANGFTPFIDMAYQGLGDGLDEDAFGARLMAEKLPELVICNSYSKNFGLYRDRVGAVTIVTSNSEAAQAVGTQVVAKAREIYSVPPAHGAFLVEMILDDEELTRQWNEELTEMRDRINGLRRELVSKLQEKGVAKDFSFIQNEKGLFSFLGLSKEQVSS
ncbi:MAG: amino acid aminotransferase, partial [Gammaproteobacteria bacterium]